jgi:uncharacterized membrane protein
VTTLDGVAMPPSETPYGLVVLSYIPRANKLEFSQAVDLPVANIVIFLPEGVTAKGGALTEGGIQDLQGASYQIYHSSPLVAGESVDFSVSGKPASGAGTTSLTQNQTLLIGVGALGFVLILAGVWMYMRDRNPVEETEEEKDEFEDTDSVLDAIIALDDLHRAGKLGDDAYHRRRDELKAKLKDEK